MFSFFLFLFILVGLLRLFIGKLGEVENTNVLKISNPYFNFFLDILYNFISLLRIVKLNSNFFNKHQSLIQIQ